MSEELIAADDQSHYEISLTAGQAFLAFVLLLLSLAASFAFGLMIGKGQADERLVVRKEPAVIQEGAATSSHKVSEGRIVDLGVTSDDFKAPSGKSADPITPATPDSTTTPVVADDAAAAAASAPAVVAAPPAAAATVIETPAPKPAVSAPAAAAPSASASASTGSASASPVSAAAVAPAKAIPTYAQLLSTTDQKTAEALAAKLINGGFTAAYVERGTSDKGTVFRVRIRFASESEARGAEAKLHEFSKDVWITK
jgi:cytoskeletal protein RodZ